MIGYPIIIEQVKLSVLCSKIEGNPKSLLEAMACKCPVIGTNVDGINDIIIDGKNGILSTLDAKNLKQSVLKILKNDKLKIKFLVQQ